MPILKSQVVATSLGLITTLALVACSAEKPPVAPMSTISPSATPASAPAAASSPRGQQGDSVVIAPDLRAACGIDDTARAPRFAYDSSSLRSEGREPLQALAECLQTGPLRGKAIQLVGRTDPRGPEDYNYRLGMARANAVAAHLRNLGVPDTALAATSRGKLDASGTDESSWAHDRRVDVTLSGTGR